MRKPSWSSKPRQGGSPINTNRHSYILVVLDAVVIYCFGTTITPNLMAQNNKKHLLPPTASGVRNLGLTRLSDSGLGVSWEALVKMSAVS